MTKKGKSRKRISVASLRTGLSTDERARRVPALKAFYEKYSDKEKTPIFVGYKNGTPVYRPRGNNEPIIHEWERFDIDRSDRILPEVQSA